VPWKVLLITLLDNQSIGISESSAALFIVYSDDICDCDDRIIRISKGKIRCDPADREPDYLRIFF
jgi:hypothetical protein